MRKVPSMNIMFLRRNAKRIAASGVRVCSFYFTPTLDNALAVDVAPAMPGVQ